MATQTATISKEQQQALKKVQDARDGVEESLKSLTYDTSVKAEMAQRLKALDAKVEAAKKLGPKAVKELLALHKAMGDLNKDINAAVERLSLQAMRRDFTAQAKGKLAEALLLLGKLKTPSLVRMMQAEQFEMRAKVDKIEKMKDDKPAVFALDDLDDAMDALVQRCKSAVELSDWLQSTYGAAVVRIEAAIKAVPQERVRRVLSAEVDFIDADKKAALAKLDIGAVKAATMNRLQALEKQATRMTALWSSLDREMVRVGGLIKDAGTPADLAGWLKALAQEKAAGWPKAGTAELLDKTVDAFEKDLGELAQTAKRGAAKASAGR